MGKLVNISEAARILGVTTTTLRNWDKKGLLKPDELTKGKARRYRIESLRNINRNIIFTKDDLKTIAYARVSSHDQKEDLNRQVQLLELYCAKHGYKYEVIQDIGSGMNYYKKGLTKLIDLILDNQVQRLILTHKDRLLRFGAELVFSICEAKNVEIIIINQGDETPSFEEELAKDVLEIITVFSARLYGSRSKKNKKLISDLEKVVETDLTENKN
ncbi:MAG: IS607 family transposase [Methanobrevibacter woesei]|nr:IS607 family transposase [Methanobrevibacter woesei]